MKLWHVAALSIAAEIGLSVLQIAVEPTYAFDWDAYMEQVARFAPDPPARPSWELRYDHLTGDTGALVYPAAHVYIHAALAWLTGWRPALWTTEHEPKGIVGYEARTVRPDGLLRAVQAGYLVLHVATLVAVWLFYAAVWQDALGADTTTGKNAAAPESCAALPLPSARHRAGACCGLAPRCGAAARDLDRRGVVLVGLTALLLSASRRARSVVVLGLFNDSWAALLTYAALALAAGGAWTPASVLYSAAVGVKMNGLLYAPGLLVLWLQAGGVRLAATQAAVCAGVQLALGAPFLVAAPGRYVGAAFNLGRAFDRVWSVNWRWLPLAVFASRAFAAALLAAHVALLVACAAWLWRPTAKDRGGRGGGGAAPRCAPCARRPRGAAARSGSAGGSGSDSSARRAPASATGAQSAGAPGSSWPSSASLASSVIVSPAADGGVAPRSPSREASGGGIARGVSGAGGVSFAWGAARAPPGSVTPGGGGPAAARVPALRLRRPAPHTPQPGDSGRAVDAAARRPALRAVDAVDGDPTSAVLAPSPPSSSSSSTAAAFFAHDSADEDEGGDGGGDGGSNGGASDRDDDRDRERDRCERDQSAAAPWGAGTLSRRRPPVGSEGRVVARGCLGRAAPVAALPPAYVGYVLATSNFVGVALARSLHFQFHVWYWHALPALLLLAPTVAAADRRRRGGGSSSGAVAPPPVPWGACAAAVVVAVCLEVAWGVHPPTAASSAVVTAAHAAVLTLLALQRVPRGAWVRIADHDARAQGDSGDTPASTDPLQHSHGGRRRPPLHIVV